MRILQVITWIAPGNPFGGPIRVAMNQRAELVRRGHDVTLVAAQPSARHVANWSSAALHIRGFDGWRAIPGAGFGGLVSPTLLSFGHTHLQEFDVVHIHVARDLVTLPIALQARRQHVPFVLQPHGMVDRSDKVLARLADSLATRRVFRDAASVLVLNDRERADVIATMPNELLRLEVLPNGVPVDYNVSSPRAALAEVLFCSRLHARKRPLAFARMAASLVSQGIPATFAMVGSDEGEGASVRSLTESVSTPGRLRLEGALPPERVLDRLRDCDVLVLPSVDEPFGMIVVEAMSVGRPVVITDSCALASFVSEHEAGIVVPSDDPEALERAVRSLIDDAELRNEMGARGRDAVRIHFSMASVADALEGIYERARKN